MLARKRPGPGACSLNHQQQGWVEETSRSAVLELMDTFIHYVLGKKYLSYFERIYIGYTQIRGWDNVKQGQFL